MSQPKHEACPTCGRPQKATYTEEEFAALLGLSLKTIQRLRYARQIPFCKTGTRIYYLPRHLDQFCERAEVLPRPTRERWVS